MIIRFENTDVLPEHYTNEQRADIIKDLAIQTASQIMANYAVGSGATRNTPLRAELVIGVVNVLTGR